MENKNVFLLAMAGCLILTVSIVLSIFALNRAKAEKQYAKEIDSIRDTMSNLERNISAAVNSKEKPISTQIKDLQYIIKGHGLKEKLERVNANAAFKAVKNKESAEGLGMDAFLKKMDAMDKSLDNMNGIISESINLDKNINRVKENSDSSYADVLDEADALKKENNRIKSKLLELKVEDEIKPLQKKLDQALQFKEKSIELYYRALLTDFESVITVAVCNEYMEAATGFINIAKLSRGGMSSYTEKARKATNIAKEQQVLLIKNLDSAENYYRESGEMLEKYKELIGL